MDVQRTIPGRTAPAEQPRRASLCEKASNAVRYGVSALVEGGIQFLANHVSWGGAFIVAGACTRLVIDILRESGHELEPEEEAIVSGVLTPIFLNWISEGPGITCATMQWALNRVRHRFNQKVEDVFGTKDYLGVLDHPAAGVFSHMILSIGYSVAAALKQAEAARATLDGEPIPAGPMQGIFGKMPFVIAGAIVAGGSILATALACAAGEGNLKAPPAGSDQDFWNWNSGSARAALDGTGRNDVLFLGYCKNLLTGGKLAFLRNHRRAAIVVPAALAGAEMWCLCAGWFRTGRLHRGAGTPDRFDAKTSQLLLDRKMVMTERFLRREASQPLNRKVSFPARHLRILGDGFTPFLAHMMFVAMANTDSDVLRPSPGIFRQMLDSDAQDRVASIGLAVLLGTAERLLSEQREEGKDPGREERMRNLRRSLSTIAGATLECGVRYFVTRMGAGGALHGGAARFVVRKGGAAVSAAVGAAQRLCGLKPAAQLGVHPQAVVIAGEAPDTSRLGWVRDWGLDVTAPFYIPYEFFRDALGRALTSRERAAVQLIPPVPGPVVAAAVAAAGLAPAGREAKHSQSEVALEVIEPQLRIHGLSRADLDAVYEGPADVRTLSRRVPDAAHPSRPMTPDDDEFVIR